MSAMAHLEKDFKTIRLCITGRVITMYSSSDGPVVARCVSDGEMRAGKRFMRRCELPEKGNKEA